MDSKTPFVDHHREHETEESPPVAPDDPLQFEAEQVAAYGIEPDDDADTIQAGDGEMVPRIAVEELRNPHYEELTDANPENAPYLSRGKKENAAYYLMDHEIVTRDFSALGKGRDLQE